MILKNTLIMLAISSLFACSSGSDTSDAGGGRGGDNFGFLSLHITDTAYDEAAEIWIKYDGVELKPAPEAEDQETIYIPIDPPLHVDMLTLQGMDSTPLFSDEILPTGIYKWTRLLISADDDGEMDSYIVLKEGGGTHELTIPSGSESGLKILGDLEIVANTPSDKTIDFDLRRSIVKTGADQYKLIPVLKLADNDESGTIEGIIPMATLTDPVKCSDTDPATGNAVYLFEGFKVTPYDVDGIDPEPYDSALVSLNADSEYEYSFGLVPFGKYTISFTCQADLDDELKPDTIEFSMARNVNVVKSETTVPNLTFR